MIRLVVSFILVGLTLHADDTAIHSVHVGAPPYDVAGPDHSDGDTWAVAWLADGSIVSPGNDNHGFGHVQSSNINFNRIDGDKPKTLVGKTINPMSDFGGDTEHGLDNCTWKSSGCLALDGALYWAIARHEYGEEGGDRFLRQDARNGSILKSTDGGKAITWSWAAVCAPTGRSLTGIPGVITRAAMAARMLPGAMIAGKPIGSLRIPVMSARPERPTCRCNNVIS